MRRLAPIVVLMCAVFAFGLLVAQIAQAGSSSPTPYVATATCTWQNNGDIITQPDGTRLLCHCERVEAIDEVWCSFIQLEAKAKPSRYRVLKKLRGVHYYGRPRIVVVFPGVLR